MHSEKKSNVRGRMLRTLAAASILTAAVILPVGCGRVQSAAIEAGIMDNPYYMPGDTQWDHGGVEEYYFNALPSEYNALYRELYARFANNEDTADLYSVMSVDQFDVAYNAVMADHPEFFWIDPQIQISTRAINSDAVGYSITYNTSVENRDAVRAQLEAAADECIATIPEGATEYQKVKRVYEYIIDLTDYDRNSPNNQNIQSVLLGHASVCAGYAKTFQYILHRMGMFCTYVSGTIEGGGDHAWNIVRIGGQYYNVDTTWGDPVFVNDIEGSDASGGGQGSDGLSSTMNYNFLCCTDAELAGTHRAEPGAIYFPACEDGSLNYYKLQGLYYETYDSATVENVMMNSVWNGARSCVMKFGSGDAYEQARYGIFEGDLIKSPLNYLMEINGATSWSYQYHCDDEFRLITIYWW